MKPPNRPVGALVALFIVLSVLVLSLGNGRPLAQATLAAPAPDCKPGLGSVLPTPASCAAADAGEGGSTQLRAPEPGSKNASPPTAVDAAGVTVAGAGAGAKAAAADDTAAPVTAQANVLDPPFATCGSSQYDGFTTTSTSFVSVASCTLTASESGFAYVQASSSLGVATGGDYEARFNLSVDATSGNAATDRWINAYTDSGDGTDKNVAVTLLTPVSAGAHTFSFLVTRYSGAGTVQLYDPSLSVVFFPTSYTDARSCGGAGNVNWTTTETSFQLIRSCTLAVPANGYVYISGSASAGLAAGSAAYEARFRLGVDTVTGAASTDRWVNVTTDGGDGTDEAVAVSLLTPVGAGSHTFYFSGTRYSGAGTVQLYDPALTVLYFPSPSFATKVCGAGGSDSWTNATTSYTTIRSCTLQASRPSVVFMDATASAGLNEAAAGNDWEGQFRLGVDISSGSAQFDRWLNVYTDTGDGTDRPVVDSGMVNVGAGEHTYYFTGRRYAGNGTLRLYSPSLSVLQLTPPANSFLPLVNQPE